MKHSILFRLASYSLRIGLLCLAITATGAMTFGSPDTIKEALRESGAYSQATDQLARAAGQKATHGTATPSLDPAAVETAVKASIPPHLLQRDAEHVIDTTYGWLRGETEQLNVRLDLQPYLSSFQQKIGDQAVQRIEALPACTTQQLRQIGTQADIQTINPLSLPCRLPGVNPQQARQEAIAQLTASNEFLRNPVLTTDTLPKDAQGKTALDHAQNAPQIYQWVMYMPWLWGAFAILCIVLMIWLSWHDHREGIKRIARSLFGVGITLLVLTGLTKLLFWYISQPNGILKRLAEGGFSEVVMTFIRSLEQAYSDKLLGFGIAYAVVGLITLMALHFIKPVIKNKPDAPDGELRESTADTQTSSNAMSATPTQPSRSTSTASDAEEKLT